MILGSIGFVENKRSSKLRSEKFTFEKIKTEEPKKEESTPIFKPTLESIPVVEPILEPPILNVKEEPQVEELPVFNDFHEISKATNRLKVVEIIPLDNKNDTPKESEKEDDFMVNDFEDTGYMSFEDAFASSNGGN